MKLSIDHLENGKDYNEYLQIFRQENELKKMKKYDKNYSR